MTPQEKYRERQAQERQRNKEQNRAEKRNPTVNTLKKHKDIKIMLELAEAQTTKSGRETIAKTKEKIKKLEANGRITASEAKTLQEIAQEQLMRIGRREYQEKKRTPKTPNRKPTTTKL